MLSRLNRKTQEYTRGQRVTGHQAVARFCATRKRQTSSCELGHVWEQLEGRLNQDKPAGPIKLGSRWSLLLTAAVTLAILAPLLRSSVFVADEGYVAYGAYRILHGQVPYRDFYIGWAPGQFYVVAGLFGLFGESLDVERFYDLAVRFGIALFIYLIVSRLASRGLAFIAATLTALRLTLLGVPLYSVYPAALLVLVAVWLLTKYFESNRRLLVGAAGCVLGAMFLFRHDLGSYAAVATALAVGARCLWSSCARARVAETIQMQLILFGGWAVVAVPVVVYLLLAAGPQALWENLVQLPLMGVRMWGLPLPPLLPEMNDVALATLPEGTAPLAYLATFSFWANFYAPVFANLLGIFVVAADARSRGPGKVSWPLVLVLLLSSFSFIYARYRPTGSMHLYIPSLTSTIILLTLTHLTKGQIGKAWRTFRYAVPSVFVMFVFPGILIPSVWNSVQVYSSPFDCRSDLPRAGCAYVKPELEASVRHVVSRTLPGEPIYAGPSRHDRIFFYDSVLPFLADRPSALPYHNVLPGVATTEPVQRDIAQRLSDHQVRYLVLYEDDSPPERTEGGKSSGVTYLDDMIRERYRVEAIYGPYSVWRRAE